MSRKISREERLRLMRFLCSFAWCDLAVHDKEREFIKRMVEKLGLDDDEKKKVDGWLKLPPRAEDVDPGDIPLEHRHLFLEACKAVVFADGQIHSEERINLDLLEELLGGE